MSGKIDNPPGILTRQAMMIHKTVTYLALVTGLLCSSAAHTALAVPALPAANTTSPAVQAIHTLQGVEMAAYRAATSFYLYNVLNRDPQQYRKMQTMLSEGDSYIAKADNSALQLKWDALKHACTTAKFTAEGGVADTDSIIAVDAALIDLTAALHISMKVQRATGTVAVNKMADMLYDEYVTMQTMTAAYLKLSADYFGGAIVASRNGNIDIAKLAIKFGDQLGKLNSFYGKHPKIGPLLKDITIRWGFVKNSLINFNENNVPFVVGRYSEQITDKLLQAHVISL